MTRIRSFQCDIPDSEVSDLHRRLDLSRWPDQLSDAGWDFGVEKTYLQSLVNYWRHEFSWKKQEAIINRLPNHLVEIDGLDMHFIHQPSTHEGATPLILTHGWPGSFLEFLEVIPRLTQPERFGGRAEDAFHVVCPSLAGFGFSPALPEAKAMHFGVLARRNIKLMALLGYDRYVAQGGDMGSPVSRMTAVLDPERCIGLHLNLVMQGPPKGEVDPQSLILDSEKARLSHAEQHQEEGTGYMILQATRAQTLAYALQDSPLGWCAWVTEKFCTWADCDLDIRNVMSWDHMLANISLYWFTGTIASSLRLYRQNHLAFKLGELVFDPVTVPTGIAVYPREIYQSPRAWVERAMPLIHWSEAGKGGHFAAMEQPQYFVEDLWRFHRALRSDVSR